MKGKPTILKLLALLIVVVAALAGKNVFTASQTNGSNQAGTPTAPTTARTGDEQLILEAAKNRRSGVLVEFSSRVTKLLPDDRDGDMHQRFLVELSDGHSLLIAHNIDLAPRAPVKAGDRVDIKGQYEWNEQGGVVHWTHHDPGKRRPGGWIRVGGKTYE